MRVMIKFILKLFSLLPLRLNHFIGGLIGRIMYIFNSRSKQVVGKNIELCFPHLDKVERQKLVKKSLLEIGKNISESGFIWCNNFAHNARYILKTNGLEHLDDGQKTILLVPHFGCWEITGRVISLNKPVTFMYKKMDDEKRNKLLLSLRQQQDLSMASADKKGVLKLQRDLKNGRIIAILPDQYPGPSGGVSADFFGKSCITMTLLAKLARKNNAKVLLTWAQRLDKGKGFELNLKPVDILAKSGAIEDDVAKMNKSIEALILTKPEQYLWNYKRFKGVIGY
ncbi:MAG: lysophospholipid acyltransferase family protein [Candidatus Thioglobus sp.]|nr:MAG: lysophospholipid acyltransferase family protein [Candidatus Thioglobus sp.]KAA0450949.1 MAG: lysophospholipid acyltransferase family protein [Candidatus Thioglobus sp.]